LEPLIPCCARPAVTLAFPLRRACWPSGVPGWSRSGPVHRSSGRAGGPAAGPLLSWREDRFRRLSLRSRSGPGMARPGPRRTGRGPVCGRSPRPVAGCGVGAQHVGQRGAHGQDQDLPRLRCDRHRDPPDDPAPGGGDCPETPSPPGNPRRRTLPCRRVIFCPPCPRLPGAAPEQPLYAAATSRRVSGITDHRTAARCTSPHRFPVAAIFSPDFYPKRQRSGAEMAYLLVTGTDWSRRPEYASSFPS